MTKLSGYYETPNARKYLQQLCKHFAHKVDATYEDEHGLVQFIFGPAHLDADSQGLKVSFDLNKVEAVDPAKHVIDSHLAKFAFREGFTSMKWQDPIS